VSRLYASRTATNVLLALLVVTVAAGFTENRALLTFSLLGVPFLVVVTVAADFVLRPTMGDDAE
jgi:hypothetical protein